MWKLIRVKRDTFTAVALVQLEIVPVKVVVVERFVNEQCW